MLRFLIHYWDKKFQELKVSNTFPKQNYQIVASLKRCERYSRSGYEKRINEAWTSWFER